MSTKAKAKVITTAGSMTANGREMRMSLRMGASGKGKVIGSVIYWPWSAISVEKADEIIFHIAKDAGVEIVNDYD